MSGGKLILVVNADSSSVKFSPFEIDASLKATAHGEIEDLDSTPDLEARVSKGARLMAKRWPRGAPEDFAKVPAVSMAFIDEHWGDDSLIAVGHPVAQGGARHTAPERLMAESSVTAPEAPTRLDRRHLPYTLTLMRAVPTAWPTLPQFDVRNIAADEEETTARHTEACPTGAAR
jgi:acetate kinase